MRLRAHGATRRLSVEALLRVVAFFGGLFGLRGGAPLRLLSGALLSVAFLGIAPGAPRGALSAAGALFGFLLVTVLVSFAVWPPIVAEGLARSGVLVLGAAAGAAIPLRGLPPVEILSSVAIPVAALSVCGAVLTAANAEAGWRRGWGVAGAVLVPTGVAALGGAFLERIEAPREHAVLGGAFLAVGLLSFLPAALLEYARMRRELKEEVALGLLPEDHVALLSVPWRRRFEKSFGRADERREYTRSALLLAVARNQQRRRKGEAVRLRQLEVLTFRTRIRRTLEARRERFALTSAVEAGLD
ncbi:MAG: hypothetical protein JNK60_10650 [Acidobacteria bacterium]|nr:hypothetical protein [Acidobacteriota bacterium]